MTVHYDALIAGGGCLGCAAAISIKRRFAAAGRPDAKVAVIEKKLIGAGLSSRHSGIVRAANADTVAADMARRAGLLWRNLHDHWGVTVESEATGALWIAKATVDGDNPKWHALSQEMASVGVTFEKIPAQEARALLAPTVTLHDNEVYYYEPDALQMDPTIVRKTIYGALLLAGVETKENVAISAVKRGPTGAIEAVVAQGEHMACSYLINAAGPWCSSIFAESGLDIPISVEPVNVANWVTSGQDFQNGMPIIADYVNLAYFRLWRDGEIHIHQPRTRSIARIARAFSANLVNAEAADRVFDPANLALSTSQIKTYENIARRRFNNIDSTIYGSGFQAFFDITPDLRFILGPDHRAHNLIHCLGAGQSFKYAPVFGEAMADYVVGRGVYSALADHFPISRFDQTFMDAFWRQVRGVDQTLATDSSGL
jgi:sarcosine oxidase, subunit beta